MAVGKILRKVLRNFAFSMAAGFVLLLLLNVFVYCPDGDSSAAPSPGDSSAGPCDCNPPEGFCVPVSNTARKVVAFLIGFFSELTATALFGSPFADDEEEEEAAGAANKAGYDDVEVGGGGGGKKY